MTKLFVVGIPRDMDEIELLELFSAYGQVSAVTIVTDINSGESKGFGFVHMEDQPGAERAIQALNGAEIDDRKISVRIAESKQAEPVQPVQSEKKKRPRLRG
ncbi:MAG: hypothetical protein JWR09_2773 [Mucilaginibacter sp.]|nr:hypothetical protein [Mucilaginibacter sp.]